MFLFSCCANFAQSIQVKNEDVVGAVPTGNAPTTSEWSTSLNQGVAYIRDFTDDIFEFFFFAWNFYLYSNFIEICSQGSKIQ